MCGLIGYTGRSDALPLLMDGLKRLEYRGYDSAGVAIGTAGGIKIVKTQGRLAKLEELLKSGAPEGTYGIGHTRWATHGEPSDINSHPHQSWAKKFAVVHNGTIENYKEIKDKLVSRGVAFASQTDTEVIAHLVEYYYDGDVLQAISKASNALDGSYALGIICADFPGKVYAVRKDNPLIAAYCEAGAMMASDIPAILSHTRDFYSLGEKEMAVLSPDGIEFYDINLEKIHKDTFHIDWSVDAAEKGGYPHFMLKEIMEQPRALSDAIKTRIDPATGKIAFENFSMTEEEVRNISRVCITACGSAAYAGMVGKEVIRRLARIPAEMELASEFRYQDPLIDAHTLVIVISQSGETADTVAALRYAKERGAKTLGIVNVLGSTVARETDYLIYTNSGPEIAVATTKAYSCQLGVLYMVAAYLANTLGLIGEAERRRLAGEILALPSKLGEILSKHDDIQYFAARSQGAKNIFFIGRGMDYAASMEAALKLKEISYIHSEAYAGGELKHGPLALIEPGSLVVALAGTKRLFDKLVTNIEQAKARGARTFGVTWEGNGRVRESCDFAFFTPETEELFTPSLTIAPLQLFAYYIAAGRGLDIDKPRNLAKSVTVE
ncbi:MAG: glutamine--fructose-6-phosphate transaminase (isomerizing) [Defluviitaleaceae bacterium]|nr:glutamine--fructose-6-phosphate transaminase (isomerizing) [Defluviitaleaceae bacterium]